MRVLILGCGVVGLRVGELLQVAGHHAVGVRRTPGTAPFPLLTGDAADAALHDRIGDVDAVLLAANPGIRRGTDNGLAAIAQLIATKHRHTRAVYTGTTSLYGDADGGPVDEQGTLEQTPEAQALRAIEHHFLAHPQALVLRATALVGPTRSFTRNRIVAAAGNELTVKGDLERPFSYLHEDDLAELCVQALHGELGTGVLNAAAPEVLTVRSYYEALAHAAGVPVLLRTDGTTVPRRRIDARRLHAQAPNFPWRPVL